MKSQSTTNYGFNDVIIIIVVVLLNHESFGIFLELL